MNYAPGLCRHSRTAPGHCPSWNDVMARSNLPTGCQHHQIAPADVARCRPVAVGPGVADPPKGGCVGPRALRSSAPPQILLPSACKPTPTRPGGRIAMVPRSTARATNPSRPRCTAWCSSMQRRSSPRPKRAPVPGVAGFAPHAARGAWPRPRRIWSTTSSPMCWCAGARLFKRPFPSPRHPEYGRTGAAHSARRA